jgi:hypothetical protein
MTRGNQGNCVNKSLSKAFRKRSQLKTKYITVWSSGYPIFQLVIAQKKSWGAPLCHHFGDQEHIPGSQKNIIWSFQRGCFIGRKQKVCILCVIQAIY